MRINLRNPTTQKILIASVLTFGAVYAYGNFLYVPRAERAKKMAVEIKNESELLNKGKHIAANFQSVQDDFARLMKTWEIAHELLPTQKEMEGLLKSITLEGQERDVDFLLFKPLDPIEKPYYWENPIQIRTQSSYHDLGEFLSAVASLDRIVNINDLKLSACRTEHGRNSQTVTADFTASIYVFKELGVPAVAGAAKASATGDAAAPKTPPKPAKQASKSKEPQA